MFGEGQQESGSSTSVNKAKELLGDEYYTSNPGDRNFELPTSGVGPQIKTDVTADDKYLLACMVKNSTNPYMVKMLEGAKKAADDLGCEIITIGPTRADNIEEQIRIMEDLIQKGVKGMVLHPSDSNGIMPGVRKATAKKIPVATIGTPAAEPTFLRTGVNYYQTGIIVGSRVAEALNGKGNVIVLEGAPGAQNGQERLQGIKDELGKHSGIEIIASQTANWNRVQGMQVMENLLQRFDDVDAVIGCNDEMAIGAIQAIKAAGLSGEVVVAGFDANKDGCLAIQNGDMMLSYNTDPFGSAYLAVSYLVQNLNASEEIPPRYFIPFPDKEENPVIDKSNVHGFMEQDAWWIQ
jgi:ABC-type sugar transport system substrate-binding protein